MSDKSLREAVKEVVAEVLSEKEVIFKDSQTYDKEICINVSDICKTEPLFASYKGDMINEPLTLNKYEWETNQGHKASIAIESIADSIKKQQEAEIVKANAKAMEEYQAKIDCKGLKVNSEHGTIMLNENGLSFDFGVALEHIKYGLKVCRMGWNGKGMYIKLEKGGDYEFSEINPFFVIKNTSNSFNTWVPSASDLLAKDWILYFGE